MHSTKPITVYSVMDTALDVLDMPGGGQRYQHTRDESEVKIKPGATPTKFIVGRISGDAFTALVNSQHTDSMKYREAFRLGVLRIENLVDQETGETIPVFMPDDRRQLPGNNVACFSDVDLLKVAPVFIEEIGSVAFARGFLPVNSVDSFVPPLSLRVAFAGRVSSQAAVAIEEARLRGQSRRSNEQAERGPAPESGEKATDATATGAAT